MGNSFACSEGLTTKRLFFAFYDYPQKINFKPNCVERAAPLPTWGLAFCTSGVVREVPNPPMVVGLLCCPDPIVVAIAGLAYAVMFRILKNSARNWALIRSVSFHFLVMDRSQRYRPLFRKIFRPMLPRVPKAGGSIMELPDTKQPHFESELTAFGPALVACDKHAALDVPENPGMGVEAR